MKPQYANLSELCETDASYASYSQLRRLPELHVSTTGKIRGEAPTQAIKPEECRRQLAA